MLKSGRTMPNKDDIPVLARWLNESASDLIQDVMARHTGTLLDAMRELVKERDFEGRKEMTSQEMMKATAKPGNAWVNVAPLGEKPDWREVKSPFGPHSDPNYGVGLLFGYDIQDFMRKQYK